MLVHVLRCIDPGQSQLIDMLNEVASLASSEPMVAAATPRAVRGSWDWVRSLAARRPEGTYWRVFHVGPRQSTVCVGACWWTDVMGRRHWFIEGAGDPSRSTFYQSPCGHGP